MQIGVLCSLEWTIGLNYWTHPNCHEMIFFSVHLFSLLLAKVASLACSLHTGEAPYLMQVCRG